MITFQHSPARFEPGQLVEHVRYAYRGVVVAVDVRCEADDTWYQTNQTQPDRGQPWYHVLVDGRRMNTYVAQSNLRADTTGGPIDHPAVEMFFAAFAEGRYVRNEREWDLG
jgi:heat shock protein HspQ